MKEREGLAPMIAQDRGKCSIGIYVRISRDDYGENLETIENQRQLLLDFIDKKQLGHVYSIYTDDNVSGSAFEREGLSRLKEDVLSGSINLLLLKDLSRLGRNNAKTLQWIDFMEEYGIRILTADGRYDSLLDNETLGIETWANERYIRDISRKIRSCLRFKIERGEYLGNAPFGYRKSDSERNKLVRCEQEAETVRLIYSLYRSGLGYTSIARILDERGILSPGGKEWNRMCVRRILLSRVYVGDTVQGISEKISFKSKKTRRLPEEEWVITQGTHEGIVTREEFLEIQMLREGKLAGKGPHTKVCHVLSGIIFCGRCGSSMYARKRTHGSAYVCGNYFRKGSSACSSHFTYEAPILESICSELIKLLCDRRIWARLEDMHDYLEIREDRRIVAQRLMGQLEASRCQHEMVYRDRLDGRISEQLFDKMNRQYETRLKALEAQLDRINSEAEKALDVQEIVEQAVDNFEEGKLSNELARLIVKSITVFDEQDIMRKDDIGIDKGGKPVGNCDYQGKVVIDYRFQIGV